MKLPVLKKQPATNSQLAVRQNPVDQIFNLMRQSLATENLLAPWFFERWLTEMTDDSYWRPQTDIIETDKELKIKIDLPGVKPEDINLEVSNQTLVISGKSKSEEEIKQSDWYYLERQTGEFRREFELPSSCEIDKIEANSKHGTLYIKIPKKPEAQKKKIEIKADIN